LLHDETHLTKIADELCKTILKLGNPAESSKTLLNCRVVCTQEKIYCSMTGIYLNCLGCTIMAKVLNKLSFTLKLHLPNFQSKILL